MTGDRKQPNKPGGDKAGDGSTRSVDDRQAVKNQGSVTTEDYPEGSNGKPDTPAAPD